MRSFVLPLALVASLAACGGAQKSGTTGPHGSSVLGSTWRSVEPMEDGDVERYLYRFDPGGKLHYERDHSAEDGRPADADEMWDDGHWTQEGTSVSMDMNDHYAEMRGNVVGESIEGTAWNKTGAKWTWSATRVP